MHDHSFMYAMGEGYRPLVERFSAPLVTGFEGLPIPGGPLGQLGFSLFAEPYLRPMFRNAGVVPFGFGHDQNLFDRLRAQQFNRTQQEAVRQAAQHDIRAWQDTFRGWAAVTGTPYGARQRAAGARLAGGIAKVTPLLTQIAPDWVDAMAGPYGSAAVLASRAATAGRYRIDPVTGQMGMTDTTIATMSGQVVEEFRRGGGTGLSAGQVGFLYQELQARGMIDAGGELGRRGTIDALRQQSPADFAAAAKRVGVTSPLDKLSAGDVDKMFLDPGFAGEARKLDAQKISRTLKDYAAAITAVRDIFGDAGRPNAPMKELIAGLEALTAGASSQVEPGKLAQMVRQTHNLAKMTGVPLANAMVLQQHAGAYGAQYGLEPIFATQAAQGSLAESGAYRAMGLGAHTAWGRAGEDQLVQARAQLRQAAAASQMTNQLGALARVNDVAGGFQKGSEAYEALRAAKEGRGYYTFNGQTKPLNMSREEMISLLANARNSQGTAIGLGEAGAVDLMRQDTLNREYAFKDGLPNVTRRYGQPDEVWGTLADDAGGILGIRFGAEGDKAGRDVARAYRSMTTATFTNRAARNEAIADQLEKSLGGHAEVRGMTAAGRRAFFLQQAERLYGVLDESSQLNYAQSFQNVQGLFNDTVLAEGDKLQTRADLRGKIQDALSPLHPGSPIRSLFGALQRARPGDPNAVVKVAGAVLGTVDSAEVNARLGGRLNAIAKEHAELEKLAADAAGGDENALRHYETRLAAFRQTVNEAAKIGREYGLTTAGASTGDVAAAKTAARHVAQGVGDTAGYLAGVRGGDPNVPTTPSAAHVRGLMDAHGLSQADAYDLAAARLRVDRLGLGDKADKAFEEATWRSANARFAKVDPALAATYARFRRAGGDLDKGGTASDAQGTVSMDARQLQAYREGVGRHVMPAYARERSYTDAARLALSETLNAAGDEARFTVTADQVEAWKKAGGTVTAEDRARARAADPALRGKTDAEVDRAVAERAVLAERTREEKARMAGFWDSPEGGLLRQQVESNEVQAESVSDAIIGSKDATADLGERGLRAAVRIRRGADKMNELAAVYSKKDVARLQAGDFDASLNLTPDQYKAVRAEVAAVQRERLADYDEIEAARKDRQGRAPAEDPKLEAERQKALEEFTANPSETARKLLEAYNFADDGRHSQELAKILSDPAQEALGRRLVDTRRTLNEAMQRGGFRRTEELVNAYRDAERDPAKLAAFKGRILGPNDNWEAFRDSFRLQTSGAFARAGRSAQDLQASFGTAPAAAGGGPMSGHLTGDLHVHFDGRPANLSASFTAGDGGHVSPGGN